jgi:SAM-dependent methyltransferase
LELFRKENIDMLYESIHLDEYNDDTQRETRECDLYNPPELVDFVKRNIKLYDVLEIGAGSGKSLDVLPITFAIEPNHFRFKALQEKAKIKGVYIEQACAECLPWDNFDTILMMGTLGHLRSPYEAFIEVNKTLILGGHFILDTFEGYSGFPGIYPTGDNLIEILADFGFKLVEKRTYPFKGDSSQFFGKSVGICVEKIENFKPENLRHLQLIKVGDFYKPVNFQKNGRDWKLI